MGQFSYKAVDHGGGQVAGVIEAVDRRSAVSALCEKGHFVLELAEQDKAMDAKSGSALSQAGAVGHSEMFKLGASGIKGKDILAMTSQLSAALRAGLPLLKAIEIIRDQQHKPVMRDMLDKLAKSVRNGESLSDAMADQGKVFGSLYISMVRVGETGGILEQTTTQLVSILDRDEKIKTSMRNASAYPIFVLGLGLLSVAVILIWVLPSILGTITGGAEVLPWPTRLLLWLSDNSVRYGWLFALLLLVSGFSFFKWINSTGRLTWDSFKLKVPVLGSVLRTIAVGRFARTLGSLTRGGVTILEALNIVRDTLGNELLGREIDEVTEKVKSGASLAEPLGVSGYFPPLLVQIVSIGEQTGKLDELLLGAAETFDEEADSAITRFISVFPAILIMLLALVIGFMIIAILMPILMMGLGSGVL